LDNIKETNLSYVKIFLPSALEKALRSYEELTDVKDSDKLKEFTEYHMAAKVAISHIELLLKVIKLSDVTSTENTKGAKDKSTELEKISAMITQAETELNTYEKITKTKE
jgi:hypothetical protein